MRIVVLDGHVLNPGDVDWSPLKKLGKLTVYEDTSPDKLAERVADQDVVLTNKVLLDAKTVPILAPHTRYIGVLATGYNTIALQEYAAHNIPVCNVVAYGVDDVAQHVFALILELVRATRLHSDLIKNGAWTKNGQWCFWQQPQLSLRNLVLGIIGFGNIGQAVGRLGHAFGMKIVALPPRNPVPAAYQPFAFQDKTTLLKNADILTLHCPLTEDTKFIINQKTLALMKPSAILINTARGQLLDEAAVAEALHQRKLHALGVDVLSQEPPQLNHPFFSTPNTLITPHIAWATSNARQRIIDLTAENIQNWLLGKPYNCVNGVA
ncbi:MAG: D-2-hydroxyacid dehydrogenase [Desulfovibrio sp.]|nr:D-2-hydroxyacid dehydrogenase [Desulfovibrio sp.]